MNERYGEQQQLQQQQYSAPKKPITTSYPVPPQPSNPYIDFKVWGPQQPPKKKTTVDPALWMPLPGQDPLGYPPQLNPMWPFYAPNYGVPIIKEYNINITGPTADHLKVMQLYEDIMPGKKPANLANTIGERLDILTFVRSVFIKSYDGEDINLDGSKDNSLLSYLKFLELNPYSRYTYSDNPYKSLPENMLIYKSCYPVRYDKNLSTIQCSPNSIGMNVRIYRLTNDEYNVKKNKTQTEKQYNVWRELAYYEYVREYIIKKKLCPNFISMYCYYISLNSNVDFNKIAIAKGRYIPPPPGTVATQLQAPFLPPLPVAAATKPIPTGTIAPQDNPALYSGKALVLLTEAPLYNLYSWCSRVYKATGNIRTMLNTGYHNSDVWRSVLFQIMIALYILQRENIIFHDFTLQDNVYIKDISTNENVTTYWKYRIKNVEYYVPSYGYQVLIDSNFKDLPAGATGFITTNPYKIYAKFFEKNFTPSVEKQYKMKAFEVFKKVISRDSFSRAFQNDGGVSLPDDIMDLLGRISKTAESPNPTINIDDYIYLFMQGFMNNRIGTLLNDSEIKNINKDPKNPATGDIMVREIQKDKYEFVLYISKNNSGVIKILTKERPDDTVLVQKDISIASLYNYYKEPIVQSFKPGEPNFSEEDLLDTFILN